MFFSQYEIDALIAEDVPLHDETVHALAMPNVDGEMTIYAREAGVMSGMALLQRMAHTLDCQTKVRINDAEAFEQGDLVVHVYGKAHNLHKLWKQAVCLLEYLAGVASLTQYFVQQAQQVNPSVVIAATRKALPGSRKLLQQAVLHGGGIIHRAGLSETLLVFSQHRTFLLEEHSWSEMITRMKARAPEKMVIVEADSVDMALQIAQAGADVIQLDKLSPKEVQDLVPRLQLLAPRIKISVAGGVNRHNVGAYAATGVDILVTSSLYKAPLCDFGVHMRALA